MPLLAKVSFRLEYSKENCLFRADEHCIKNEQMFLLSNSFTADVYVRIIMTMSAYWCWNSSRSLVFIFLLLLLLFMSVILIACPVTYGVHIPKFRPFSLGFLGCGRRTNVNVSLLSLLSTYISLISLINLALMNSSHCGLSSGRSWNKTKCNNSTGKEESSSPS